MNSRLPCGQIARTSAAAYCAVYLLAVGCTPSDKFAEDKQSALATVQTLFDAMAAGDAAMASELFVDNAQLTRVDADSTGAGQATNSAAAWLAGLPAEPDVYLERMFSPVAHVDGDLAMVWAPYDFHRRGEFSHCGTNVIQMVRVQGRWRILSVTYSVQRQDCPARPVPGR